jgi:putative transposase
MTKTIITTLPDRHGFSPDPLTDLLRSMLLEAYSGDRIEDGCARRIRHVHLPKGGSVLCRSRCRACETVEKVRFASTILPPYLRKAKSIEELLP